MHNTIFKTFYGAVAATVVLCFPALAADYLPSWNETPSKKAIMAFVDNVTKRGSPDFVPTRERIAVFDNDGTLWPEQPMYVQLAFALDRIKALAVQHPEWKETDPFKAALAGDLNAIAASGNKGVLELVMASHAGNTTEEFERIVSNWLGTARHPKFNKPYTELVYQPMIELMGYLRANGFKTFIVSGGGIEFMRPWVEKVYGIPPDQVIGSSVKVKYEVRSGKPVLVRLPEINFVDDKAGKPVGIHYYIGQHPVAAFGNSDGDFEMLEWVTSGKGARLGAFVHHDDADREFSYDRGAHFGSLSRRLDEAPKHGWTIISMKADWKCVFPFQCQHLAHKGE